MVSCHTVDSKSVKQEVNGTVILPPLVLPGTVVCMSPRQTNRQMNAPSIYVQMGLFFATFPFTAFVKEIFSSFSKAISQSFLKLMLTKTLSLIFVISRPQNPQHRRRWRRRRQSVKRNVADDPETTKRLLTTRLTVSVSILFSRHWRWSKIS